MTGHQGCGQQRGGGEHGEGDVAHPVEPAAVDRLQTQDRAQLQPRAQDDVQGSHEQGEQGQEHRGAGLPSTPRAEQGRSTHADGDDRDAHAQGQGRRPSEPPGEESDQEGGHGHCTEHRARHPSPQPHPAVGEGQPLSSGPAHQQCTSQDRADDKQGVGPEEGGHDAVLDVQGRCLTAQEADRIRGRLGIGDDGCAALERAGGDRPRARHDQGGQVHRAQEPRLPGRRRGQQSWWHPRTGDHGGPEPLRGRIVCEAADDQRRIGRQAVDELTQGMVVDAGQCDQGHRAPAEVDVLRTRGVGADPPAPIGTPHGCTGACRRNALTVVPQGRGQQPELRDRRLEPGLCLPLRPFPQQRSATTTGRSGHARTGRRPACGCARRRPLALARARPRGQGEPAVCRAGVRRDGVHPPG